MLGADKFLDSLTEDQRKTHANQRYTRGFSDIDMWNFDVLIADVIVAGCDWMLANGSTSPWKLEEEEWRTILKKIRKGFSKRDSAGIPKPSKKAWKLLRDNYQYLWD